MSVNASWLRMFLEMRRRHGFMMGDVLALGVQDVMFTHATARELLAERKAQIVDIPEDECTYALSRNQRQFTQDPRHYMSIKDLYRMMGYRSLQTLDAFENDQPDLLWDLSRPVPEDWHNRYDLVFDIGVLEHTADIFQSLENVANLVKPGGWILLYLPMVSPINSCLYHPNPPFYFDILSGNGFTTFDAWINWMPDWDQQNDIRTVWLNYKYNDDVYIWRPRYYTIMCFIGRKGRHVGSFQPVLQNFYKEWHGGKDLFATSQEELLLKSAGLAPSAAVRGFRRNDPFYKALLRAIGGWVPDGNANNAWEWPTAQSRPTKLQLERYPRNEHGVPYAKECIVAPVDSRPQSDIPEQMLVNSPPREQLYL
jgi:hypothetical protein